MRILVAVAGTRGDVQPAFVICHELARAGHTVRLCAPKTFAAWAPAGFEFFPIDVDVKAVISSSAAQKTFEAGVPSRIFRFVERVDLETEQAFGDALVAASEGVDAVLTHPLIADRAAAVAEYRKVPIVVFSTLPLWRTREFSPVIMGAPRLGPLNTTLHRLAVKLHWRSHGAITERLRKRLGLQAAGASFLGRAQEMAIPSLEVYSRTLCPAPSDWGAERVMTGLVRMPDRLRGAFGEQALPEHVEQWLAGKPAPLFVTFGSMPLLDKPGLIDAIEEVCAARDLPVIFGVGWTQVKPRSEYEPSLFVSELNHAALLSRCVATMHHGGAGSTAAVAEAGIPAIVCPAFVDQPFWARRVGQLGVGVTVPYAKFSIERFRTALDRVLDAKMQARACELGAEIRAEDGAAHIADAFAWSLAMAPELVTRAVSWQAPRHVESAPLALPRGLRGDSHAAGGPAV